MPQFDEQHVKLEGGVVLWDGVTQPETVTQGAKAGGSKWTLKVAFPPSCPDLQLYDALANKKLMESSFRGTLPAGGRMPIAPIGPEEFGGGFGGWYCINFKTTLRMPDLYTEHGQPLDPMQLANVLYPGQRVDVLAHVYDYNTVQKGIGAGMDAFAVHTQSGAPRLQIGGGGPDTAAAFGGGSAHPQGGAPAGQPGGYNQGGPAPQNPQGGYNQPPQNAGGYNQGGAPAGGPGGYNPQGGPAPENPQGGYNQPPQNAGGYNPQGGQPGGYNGGGYPQNPPQGAPAHNAGAPDQSGHPGYANNATSPTTYPSNGPAQAHNFLPGQQ